MTISHWFDVQPFTALCPPSSVSLAELWARDHTLANSSRIWFWEIRKKTSLSLPCSESSGKQLVTYHLFRPRPRKCRCVLPKTRAIAVLRQLAGWTSKNPALELAEALGCSFKMRPAMNLPSRSPTGKENRVCHQRVRPWRRSHLCKSSVFFRKSQFILRGKGLFSLWNCLL